MSGTASVPVRWTASVPIFCAPPVIIQCAIDSLQCAAILPAPFFMAYLCPTQQINSLGVLHKSDFHEGIIVIVNFLKDFGEGEDFELTGVV